MLVREKPGFRFEFGVESSAVWFLRLGVAMQPRIAWNS